MLTRLTIFVAAFYFSFAPLAWACSPLVVYIGGLSEVNKPKLRLLFERERNFYQSSKWYEQGGPKVKTRFFEWGDFWASNDEVIAETIVKHRRFARGAGNRSPIVVVGYSYGGDTAYHALEELSSSNSGIAPLLVTLDAVGERAWYSCADPLGTCFLLPFDWYFRDHKLEKPTAGRWLNVWTSNGAEGFRLPFMPPMSMMRSRTQGRCDAIADYGGPYGRQRRATNIKYSGDHCGVKGMFGLVKEKIDQYILSSCR